MIKQLKIGGYTYKIKPERSVNKWGTCDSDNKTITINPNSTSEQKCTTILHEAIHAIASENGLNEHLSDGGEKIMVRVLESSIVQLFKTNKTFAKEFIKSL